MTMPDLRSRYNRGTPTVQTAPVVRDYLTVSSNKTCALSTADVHLILLGASVTLTMDTSAAPDRTVVRVYLTQDGTGSRLVTWSGVTWIDGVTPTLSTTAGAMDLFEFTFKASTSSPTWIGRWLYTATQTIAGALNVVGNFSVATTKFTVAAASGNTVIAGTLGVTGLSTFQAFLQTGTTLARFENTLTNVPAGASGVGFEFGVSSGFAVIAGANRTTGTTAPVLISGSSITLSSPTTTAQALSISGDFAVNTSKFTVTASSGNTSIAGDLSVGGSAYFVTASTGSVSAGPSCTFGGVGIVTLQMNSSGNGQNVQVNYSGKTAGAVAQRWRHGMNLTLSTGVFELYDETAGLLRMSVDLSGFMVLKADTALARRGTNMTNGAAAAAGTLTNAPTAGNPTKWLAVDDNGTTRYVPAW